MVLLASSSRLLFVGQTPVSSAERRAHLGERMARVVGVLTELAQLSVEELCDERLDRIATG